MRDILTGIEQDLLLSENESKSQRRRDLPKRFYKDAAVETVEYGDELVFEVRLDGRSARTPGRALIRLPTRASAQMIVDEFAAQQEVIDPVTMPAMRIANTAIDGVLRDPEPVADDMLKFAGSDLLCYRADTPEGLVARQNDAWNPVLAWAEKVAGSRFVLASGVIYVEQPPETLAGVRRHLESVQADPFMLTCLHLMTSLSGSALLALAVEARAITPEDAWKAAHVDEDWQIDHWGQDSEAVARRNARWRDFRAAAAVIEALRS